ncbi:expressed protein [Echinococcus multilocularis]|uniref:Expressed protein n=1 Tax=Echinococcus multilocularis TaxID=6211 RepID=A0A068YFT6_ECHMU|nr:expressed protein [Echinococcus multilocularis]
MEELRQRLHEVEREKLGKTEECDRLSNEVAVLMRELNEAKARESALMSVSESPVVEPSVVEAVRADPLLSSTPPGLVQKTPVIVDVCHGHEEESSIRRVDEGLLMARLSALAETVSTASSLQAEVRNSWLVVMEHAESGVASLLRDQVDLKVRLGELEANVKSLNAELEEKDARVQMLTRDVAEQGEELQRRDRSLHELEARMTAVSTRLLSQLGDLMSAVNCGEGRVAELMSMVEEAGAREGELKEQLMENVVQSRQLESELAGERAKVSKLGGEVAEKELEKEALLRSCEQMTEELKVKASEQRALEERIEQVVATTLHDAEVVATEMEELRQRLHEVEREKLGKTEECDRLSNEVAVLMRELNEAKARESALMSVPGYYPIYRHNYLIEFKH